MGYLPYSNELMWLSALFVAVGMYFAYLVHVVRMQTLHEVLLMTAALSTPEPNVSKIKASVKKLKNIVKMN